MIALRMKHQQRNQVTKSEGQKQSQKHEKRLAKKLGGTTVSGSGSQWSHDADVKTRDLLVEHKFTTKKSFSVKSSVWEKIYREAWKISRTPILAIHMDGTDLVVMDVKEHDRRMALVLGLTHFNNLAYARALSRSRVNAHELAQVAGVTFQKQLVTTREVTQENPDLYFQIQSLNRVTSETARWLLTAVEEIRDVVADNNAEAFAALMGECRDFLVDSIDVTP